MSARRDEETPRGKREEGDEKLNQLLWRSENDLGPVLKQVIINRTFSIPELVALKFLVAIFSARTRKSAAFTKVFPRFMAEKAINAAIACEKLPPCPDGAFTVDMMNFAGGIGFSCEAGLPTGHDSKCIRLKVNYLPLRPA